MIIMGLCLLGVVAASISSCTPLPPRRSPPRNINDLRIDDFKAIMAMGDSMSAGFNAVKPSMQEYRGVSFSIGGDPGAITLPNLINSVKSTVKLVGPSVGSLAQPQLKTTCTGADVEHVCRLNAAVDGSDLQDLRDLQVGYLRDTLSNAPWAANISISKDWKLLTIFSGLDDVVFYNATDPTKQSTNTTLFAANLDHLLQAIRDALPRTFVNVVMLPEHFDPRVTTSRFSCWFFKWYSKHAGIHWTDTATWTATIKEYNQVFVETALRWKAKGLTDFGVSLQPFTQETVLTIADFDTEDCFHPNLLAHQGMAVGLWNNMLADSSGMKKASWNASDAVKCPDASSRLVV